MKYLVSKKNFTRINETSGTIQNASQINTVEISDRAELNSGVLLYPLNRCSFSDVTLYARCVDGGGWAEIRVVPFTLNLGVASGGTSSTTMLSPDDATNAIINDAFNDNDIVTDPDADDLVNDMWHSAEPVDTGDGFSDDINAMFNNP